MGALVEDPEVLRHVRAYAFEPLAAQQAWLAALQPGDAVLVMCSAHGTRALHVVARRPDGHGAGPARGHWRSGRIELHTGGWVFDEHAHYARQSVLARCAADCPLAAMAAPDLA